MNTLELSEPETSAANQTPASHQLRDVIRLPLGLLGFEHVKNYVLLTNSQEEPFMWLQMLEDAKHAFLVVSPSNVVPDYRPDINEQDVEFLGLNGPEDAVIVNIVTLRQGRATVNLKGPIVINRHTMVGKQVIPNNAQRFNVRHLLTVS
jgi:flagellar assembly factor FliW